MPDAVTSPLRVGLWPGVGRCGMHLIERFAEGSPFRVVAACDPTAALNLLAPFGVRLVNTPEELTHAADIDVLWCLNGLVPIGPSHSQHTIVETPLTLSLEAADQAFREAAEQGRLLLVHHPRRGDLEFRQALTVASDANIGAVRAAKFVSWSYGLPPRGATRGNGPLAWDASDDPQITKFRFVAHALDQLVPLIGDEPVSVFATGDPLAVGTPDLRVGYSLALRIVFKRGCEAEIDIRLDSPTPFQSGWTLTGERGGYANGRQYTLTEDGEVFDSPVTPSDGDQGVDQFEWLARQIRGGVVDATEEARVRTVVALLDAAQRSLVSRQVEAV